MCLCVLYIVFGLTEDSPNIVPLPTASAPINVKSHNKDFNEIVTSRFANQAASAFQIRVTDNLTFFKIDSSTNELPLSEIDFSLNPGTPETHATTCTAHKSNSPSDQLHKKQAQLLTMRRMESADEPDYVEKLRTIRRMSPMATNERPLTCNCNGGHSEDAYPHSHSKSEADLTDMLAYHRKDSLADASLPTSPERGHSFDEEFQLSSSAPASLLSGEFLRNYKSKNMDSLKPSSASNSPTASTLQLCQALDNSKLASAKQQVELAGQSNVGKAKTNKTLASAQSAPVIVEPMNPFRFPDYYSFKSFAPIAENAATNINVYSSPMILTTSASTSTVAIASTQTTAITTTQTPQHYNNTHAHLHYQNQHHHFHHHHHQLQHHHAHHHPQLHYNPHYYQHYYNVHHSNGSTTNNTAPPTTITQLPLSALPNVVVTLTSSSNDSSSNNLTNLLLSPCDSNNEFNIAPNPYQHPNINVINPVVISSTYPNNIPTLLSHDPNNNIQTLTYNSPNDPYNNDSNINAMQSSCNSFSSSFLPLTMNHMPSPPIATATTTTNIDGTATSISSSSSVSSTKRQRHSIAGQMSYMKMLGFGGFSKKMTTSTNSLFSTAVISGSSSAPNLRDMIPVSSSGKF